jgi:hypothetical protein
VQPQKTPGADKKNTTSFHYGELPIQKQRSNTAENDQQDRQKKVIHMLPGLSRFAIIDGLVKSPTPALRCISQSLNVRWLRLMTPKFARFEFELFTRPFKSDFLRVHHYLS